MNSWSLAYSHLTEFGVSLADALPLGSDLEQKEIAPIQDLDASIPVSCTKARKHRLVVTVVQKITTDHVVV